MIPVALSFFKTFCQNFLEHFLKLESKTLSMPNYHAEGLRELHEKVIGAGTQILFNNFCQCSIPAKPRLWVKVIVLSPYKGIG